MNQQLLIYGKSKGGVRKNKVMKAIKMEFTLLERRNELVISIFTSSVVNKIGQSKIHTAIGVNTWVEKTHKLKVNAQWWYRSSLMIDKMSMIDLKLLTSIDQHLRKVRRISLDLILAFSGTNGWFLSIGSDSRESFLS